MTYRSDLDALAARHATLDAEVERATRARDDAKALLDDAKARLPIYPRVADLCPARWDEMHGDAQSRHCTHCATQVYDLSALTEAEAEALIREKEGKLCVSFLIRADGRLQTRDCEVARTRLRRRRWTVAAVASLLALGTLVAVTNRQDRSDPDDAFTSCPFAHQHPRATVGKYEGYRPAGDAGVKFK